jgi:menaquinone-dependent protoporphyrinogen oxidase
MRVLVTTASDESAMQIGARIGAVLGGRGHEVDLRSPDDVIHIDDYDVVVLGSALDNGHWQDEARLLVLRAEGELAARPVWLFSSEAALDASPDTVLDVTEVMSATHAFEHRTFRATGDRSTSGVVTAVLVPDDDGDPWNDVDRWAISIADSISSG